jgi:hypothetical protein
MDHHPIGRRRSAQHLFQTPPGADHMKHQGALQLTRQAEMDAQGIILRFRVKGAHGLIQPALSHRSMAVPEKLLKAARPIYGGFL